MIARSSNNDCFLNVGCFWPLSGRHHVGEPVRRRSRRNVLNLLKPTTKTRWLISRQRAWEKLCESRKSSCRYNSSWSTTLQRRVLIFLCSVSIAQCNSALDINHWLATWLGLLNTMYVCIANHYDENGNHIVMPGQAVLCCGYLTSKKLQYCRGPVDKYQMFYTINCSRVVLSILTFLFHEGGQIWKSSYMRIHYPTIESCEGSN